MNQEIVDAVHKAITPAELKDMYYPGMENTEAVAFATYVENRFQAGVPSRQFGSSSTIIFNPTEGLGDILLKLTLPAPAIDVSYNGIGASIGWGYSAIRQLGIRVGNSSLYYFTSDQLLASVLSECEDSVKRDQVLNLGGQALSGTDFNSEAKRTAFVYIKCPWNSPSAQEKPLGLPTDLLTQPVQFILEFDTANKFLVRASGAAAGPSQFSDAFMQFRQTHMMNGSDLLARRVDMNSNALSLPLKNFQQTTFRTGITTTSANEEAQINLTGLRSGSLKSIDIWATTKADYNGGNPNRWRLLGNVKLLVNGLVYYDTPSNSNQFWSIVDRKTAASAAYNAIDASGSTLVPGSQTMYWLNIPFAQHTESLAGDSVVSTGIPLMNSVMNLSVTFADAGEYILSASYNYAANLMFSRGKSCLCAA
jgi:hypothetical protein